MKKSLVYLLCFCLLIPLFSACSEERERLGYLLADGAETYPESVLELNGESVSFDEFRYYYLNCRDEELKKDENHFQSASAEEALKEEVLDLLKNKFAVTLLCREEGIKLDSEELKKIESEMETTAELYGGSDAFLKNLHASYMSRQYYREMLEFTAMRDQLMAKQFGQGGEWAWTDEEFYRYFEDRYLAVQVLKIAYRGDDTAEDPSQTLEVLAPIQEELAAGADFWAMIETYGEDDEMEGYPDGYYVTRGEAEDALYDAAEALKIGEISDPVAGADGLYLIRRVALKKDRMDENRMTALYGYTDSLGSYHSGAYDDVFEEKCRERAAAIEVRYEPVWEQISTKTVF